MMAVPYVALAVLAAKVAKCLLRDRLIPMQQRGERMIWEVVLAFFGELLDED